MEKQNPELSDEQLEAINCECRPDWLTELIEKQKAEGRSILVLPIDLESPVPDEDCDEWELLK